MLGEQLRAARLEADWSQEKLAEEAGISRNYVSLLELNRKSPTLDVLLAIKAPPVFLDTYSRRV